MCLADGAWNWINHPRPRAVISSQPHLGVPLYLSLYAKHFAELYGELSFEVFFVHLSLPLTRYRQCFPIFFVLRLPPPPFFGEYSNNRFDQSEISSSSYSFVSQTKFSISENEEKVDFRVKYPREFSSTTWRCN